MENANVAFTDLGGLTGTRFPKVSEFEDQQQYQGSQSGSNHCFKRNISKGIALQGVIEKAAIGAPIDSLLRLNGEPKTGCDVLVANLGRALELLSFDPTVERPYNADEIEFLCQVAGQIATAIDKAPASPEVPEQRNMLAEEKLYLEEEFRSEMGFERIIGGSPALKHVLQLV